MCGVGVKLTRLRRAKPPWRRTGDPVTPERYTRSICTQEERRLLDHIRDKRNNPFDPLMPTGQFWRGGV